MKQFLIIINKKNKNKINQLKKHNKNKNKKGENFWLIKNKKINKT